VKRAACGLVLALSIGPVAALDSPTAPAPGVVLVSTESRVEVDATGAVVAVEPRTELPAAVAEALAADIRHLRFAPPTIDGRAVAGVTYVRQDACAAPDNGVYRLATRFRGNGPLQVTHPFPKYPKEAQMAGASAVIRVSYRVLPSGATELHDGQPVTTLISYPVEFQAGDSRRYTSLAQARASAQRENAESRRQQVASNASCQAAMDAGDATHRQVAMDSPMRLLTAD
jgi:hypothetical protein